MNEDKRYTEIEHCDSADNFLKKLASLKGDQWHFRGQPDEKYRLISSLWRNPRKDQKEGQIIAALFKHFCDLFPQTAHEQITLDVEKSLASSSRHPLLVNFTKERGSEFLLRIRFEYYLLSQFYTISNKAGLKIPDNFITDHYLYDPSTWCDYNPERGLTCISGFRTDGYLLNSHLSNAARSVTTLTIDASLPQHYGLPTRLLDWTTNCKKASYFAAYSYSTREYNQDEKIAVFAIKKIRLVN